MLRAGSITYKAFSRADITYCLRLIITPIAANKSKIPRILHYKMRIINGVASFRLIVHGTAKCIEVSYRFESNVLCAIEIEADILLGCKEEM